MASKIAVPKLAVPKAPKETAQKTPAVKPTPVQHVTIPKAPTAQKPPKPEGLKAPAFAGALGVSAIEKPRSVFRPAKQVSPKSHWSGKN